jgi:hypothetical protein
MPVARRVPNTSIRTIYLRVAPRDIALIKFLFESYEEVAIVRTIDRHAATIVVLAMDDFLPVVRAILRELQAQISSVEIPPPETGDDWLMRAIDPDQL